MLSGEMGRSVFRHPDSYLKLQTKYRGTLAQGKNGKAIKIGLAIHWNKICGDCFYVPHVYSATLYNSSYAQVGPQ
jgi:hypothetical protein